MSHFQLTRDHTNRERFILSECAGKRVLHLGCADYPYTDESIQAGTWLHNKVTEVATECIGVDLSQETVKHLQENHGIKNVVVGNAEELDQLDMGQFDIILAGELIEHLNNPGLFLETAKLVLKDQGKLIITTANAFCFRRMLRIPFGVESVHPDHVYYFSHATLSALATRFGYKLERLYSYRIPNKKPLAPYLVERLAFFISPNLGEGIIHVYTK